jgi:hypothetical protein
MFLNIMLANIMVEREFGLPPHTSCERRQSPLPLFRILTHTTHQIIFGPAPDGHLIRAMRTLLSSRFRF